MIGGEMLGGVDGENLGGDHIDRREKLGCQGLDDKGKRTLLDYRHSSKWSRWQEINYN